MLYPPVCGICEKIEPNWLCKKCERSLKKYAKFHIVTTNKEFQKHFYVFEYKGMVRQMLLDYKFNEKPYIFRSFVKFLFKNEKFFQKLQGYDIIIPVPISKKRKKQRGYNQSLLIAKAIAKQADLPWDNHTIIKHKEVIEQSKLNKQERMKNIQGAYKIKNAKRITGKKILLVDDIYTTGSTVKECSKILNQANPKEIAIFTIAKD